MKKLLLTASILSVASLGFSAEKLELNGGGTTLDLDVVASIYDQINITDDDGAIRYSGSATTETITVQRSNAYGTFHADASGAYINANANYTFSGAVVLDCTSTAAGNHVISTNVEGGVTLEFTQGITIKNAAGNTRTRFGAEGDSGYLKDETAPNGKVILNAVTGSVVATGSTITTPELILVAVDFTVKNTNSATNSTTDGKTIPVYLGKYTHLCYGAVLDLQTDVQMNKLATRSSKDNASSSGDYAGTVRLNGNTLTITSIDMNVEGGHLHGNLLVDMAGVGSEFIATSTGANIYFNRANGFTDYYVEFINFDTDDKILFRKELSSDQLARLSINGLSGSDIQHTTEVIDTITYHSYYVVAVPEPAEWAMIFGAIALGFVAYRRRK